MILEIAAMTWPIWAVIAFALLVMPYLKRAMEAPVPPQKPKVIDAEFETVEVLTHVDITV